MGLVWDQLTCLPSFKQGSSYKNLIEPPVSLSPKRPYNIFSSYGPSLISSRHRTLRCRSFPPDLGQFGQSILCGAEMIDHFVGLVICIICNFFTIVLELPEMLWKGPPLRQ